MVAVATKDISVGAHVLTWLRGFSTRGRWVFDIDSHKEFESNTFTVEIRYEARSFYGIEVPAKIFMELFDEGMGSTNHIFPTGYAMYVNLVLLLKEAAGISLSLVEASVG